MKSGHAFVLGSGIAGLSLAEILSRNGWRITLLDTAQELGGDASRCTQNWFHTGWLYAALPSKAAMLGCNRALRCFHGMYGSVVDAEVLNLECGEQPVGYPASDRGWFSAEWVHYAYATATADLSPMQRLFWKTHLHAVAFRRLRALGYDASVTSSLEPGLMALLNYWENSEAGHRNYHVVRSTDAQINTRRVLNTLLSLLGDRAQVIPGAQYSLTTAGGRSAVCLEGETHIPDLVVMATGKSLAPQLLELGHGKLASRFKSVCSPIVVLNRALDLPNFIRFTPNLPTTVNHIKYEIDGVGQRSTLGSYDYFPAGQAPDISPFANRMCKRLNISTSDVASVYYGTKTEFVGSMKRRYNHAIERVNENTYFAIPGKFSQFPLLAREFAEQLGLRMSIANATRGTLRTEVAPTAPELSVSKPPPFARTRAGYPA
jgi:glycine/D-amino acid oxidase-like deaminating enzyme